MRYFIIRTDGTVEAGDVDEADDNAQMRLWESVSDGYFENVRVIWRARDKYCSMLIDEQGKQKELPLNELASKIYWNSKRVHDPGQYDPRVMDPIVGDVAPKKGGTRTEGIVVMSNSERIALFIDGQNLYDGAKSLGFGVDFKRLLFEFQKHGTIVRSHYYAAISENADQSARPLLDWLNYNGFTVLAKRTKEFDDGEGRKKIKGNIGVELAVNALEISDRIDHIVLFSGDGDLRALVEAVQRRGVRVTVVSTIRTKPPMVADELRRQADAFLELDEMKASIGRAVEVNNQRSTARP